MQCIAQWTKIKKQNWATFKRNILTWPCFFYLLFSLLPTQAQLPRVWVCIYRCKGGSVLSQLQIHFLCSKATWGSGDPWGGAPWRGRRHRHVAGSAQGWTAAGEHNKCRTDRLDKVMKESIFSVLPKRFAGKIHTNMHAGKSILLLIAGTQRLEHNYDYPFAACFFLSLVRVDCRNACESALSCCRCRRQQTGRGRKRGWSTRGRAGPGTDDAKS